MQARYWKDTLTLFNHTVAVTSGNYVAHNLLAGELGRRGQLTEAMEELNRSLEARPQYEGAIYNRAVALISMRDFAAAEKLLASLVEKRGEDPMVWNNLAVARLNLERVDDAIACAQKSLALDPGCVEAMATLGDAFLKKMNWTDAAKWSEAALQLRPDLANAHATLGAALSNLGRTDEAITHYRAALHLNPTLVDAHLNLGVTLLLQRKLDEAIEQFEEVLRVSPQHPAALRFLEAARRKQSEGETSSPIRR
jgi:tetratricopeptide (TPR) repeat protein